MTKTPSRASASGAQHPQPSAAPIWRRLAALLYDSFILVALSFLYGAIITAFAASGRTGAQDYQPMFDGVLFPIGWALTLAGFYCFFWHRSGQTLGMKTWHIKLVTQATGSCPPSWERCALRAAVAAPAVLVFGVGYIVGAVRVNRETLQDSLSKTQVIMVPKEGNKP